MLENYVEKVLIIWLSIYYIIFLVFSKLFYGCFQRIKNVMRVTSNKKDLNPLNERLVL